TFNIQILDNRGYLKFSPSGDKLASANATNGLYLYNFDRSTGQVLTQTPIDINFSNSGKNPQIPYGLEFSPNNNLLYVTTYFEIRDEDRSRDPNAQYGALLQYNLASTNISSSETVIDNRTTFRGGLQLAPNGKIYRAMNATYSTGLPFLSAIDQPNNTGTACNYRHNAFRLSRNSRQGLPPFITSFFTEKIDIIKNNISTTYLALCDGTTYPLEAPIVSGATYSWTLNGIPLSNTTNTQIVDQEGKYEVLVDPNTGNCDQLLRGVAIVSYNKNPDAFDYTLIQCDEDGISGGFTRFNLNEATDGLTGGAANVNVRFFLDSIGTNEITNYSSYNYNTDNPHPIYVTVTHNETSCFNTSILSLDVSFSSLRSYTFPAVCDEIDSEDGINTFNLNTISTGIQALNGTTYPIIYYASYDDALLEQDALNVNYKNTTAYSQTIYARTENHKDCFGIYEVSLSINKLPDTEPTQSYNYCLNTYPKLITIDSGILANPENYTYLWSTGETTHSIQINEAGTYSVTITNANNCSKERIVTVEASNIATIDTLEVKDTSNNNTITIITSGEGEYTFALLDGDNNILFPYQESNIFENIKPGFYYVSVKDTKNDCGTIKELVSVIGFPKFFTPNNDGHNDTWQIIGVSNMFQPNTKALIYNRYGKLLKEISPLDTGWDGTFNGESLPSDDYWFVVKLQDGRVYKNHFSLKR
ncbi:MAG: T9SS type B sorting domain-containing protein, partial [Aestuariibaculum sp.]